MVTVFRASGPTVWGPPQVKRLEGQSEPAFGLCLDKHLDGLDTYGYGIYFSVCLPADGCHEVPAFRISKFSFRWEHIPGLTLTGSTPPVTPSPSPLLRQGSPASAGQLGIHPSQQISHPSGELLTCLLTLADVAWPHPCRLGSYSCLAPDCLPPTISSSTRQSESSYRSTSDSCLLAYSYVIPAHLPSGQSPDSLGELQNF